VLFVLGKQTGHHVVQHRATAILPTENTKSGSSDQEAWVKTATRVHVLEA
jgi:hypothetical protein